jgi:hypothetical protein
MVVVVMVLPCIDGDDLMREKLRERERERES